MVGILSTTKPTSLNEPSCPSLKLNPDATPLRQPKEDEEGADEEAVMEHGGNDDVADAGALSNNQ